MRKILCFGDSNTWGYNGRSGERYPENIRWTGLLQKRMSGMGVEIIEQGLCGRTTVFQNPAWPGRRGMDVFPDMLKEASPVDILILMLGTNDCKTEFHADPEMVGEGMEEIVRTAREIAPETEILLISPIFLDDEVWSKGLDPEFGPESVKTSQGLKNVYQKIAEKYHTDFMAASDYAYPGPADREQLDVAGHRKLSEAVYTKVMRMLKTEENRK